ncbi:MAG: hypothetical protein MUC89_08525 [Acetobacteraceae bacterium]|jgi:hypothetical protein|nr:hypothetical protein [Acetobacteraceae bacterium]
MNPELLRNLWLEITPQRLIAMPAVLFLVFGVVLLSDGRGALPDAAWWTGIAVGVLWGARQAAGAVMGEVAGRTWDSQRASALTPAQMGLGKLFGATAYAWYGVGLCALVHVGAGGAPAETVSLILRTGLAHGVALFASLVLLGLGGRSLVMTSLPHLAGIVAAAGAGLEAMLPVAAMMGGMAHHAAGADVGGGSIAFYGVWVDRAIFSLATMALFWAWSVAGCIALLRGELNVPRRLPAWPLFLGFVALYAAGLGAGPTAPVALTPAFLALCLLTSAAALLEPKSRRSLTRLFAGAREGLFPSLQALLAALAAGISLIVLPSTAGWGVEGWGSLLPLAAVLFLARDIALVRLVSLRRGGLRGAVAAIVWFAVLYGMLPVVLAGAGAEAALMLFYPLPAEGASAATALTLGAPAAQGAVLWALLARSVRQGPSPAAP